MVNAVICIGYWVFLIVCLFQLLTYLWSFAHVHCNCLPVFVARLVTYLCPCRLLMFIALFIYIPYSLISRCHVAVWQFFFFVNWLNSVPSSLKTLWPLSVGWCHCEFHPRQDIWWVSTRFPTDFTEWDTQRSASRTTIYTGECECRQRRTVMQNHQPFMMLRLTHMEHDQWAMSFTCIHLKCVL